MHCRHLILPLALVLTASACGGGSKLIHKNFLQPDLGGRATPNLAALGTLTALVERNGRFYVAGQTGVAAVNPDGTVAWLKVQPAALMRYVAAAEGKVATSSFDSSTIKDLSYFPTGKRDFVTADSAAVALLSDTGEELWTAKLSNPDWLSAPTIHTASVAVQSGSAFHIFNRENGSVVMTAQLPLTVEVRDKFPLRAGRTRPARFGDDCLVAWGQTRLQMTQTGKELYRLTSNDGFDYAGAFDVGGKALFSRGGYARDNGVIELQGDGRWETWRNVGTHDCFDVTGIGKGILVRCGEALLRLGARGEPSWTVRGKASAPSLFGTGTADADMKAHAYGFIKSTSGGGFVTANFDIARAHSALGSIVVGGNGHLALASRADDGDTVTVLEEKKGQYVGIAGAASTLAIATTTGLQLVEMP